MQIWKATGCAWRSSWRPCISAAEQEPSIAVAIMRRLVVRLNLAIEAASDRIGQDPQVLSGIVKVMDSAVVFVTPCAIALHGSAVILDQSL